MPPYAAQRTGLQLQQTALTVIVAAQRPDAKILPRADWNGLFSVSCKRLSDRALLGGIRTRI
jgi:hypothetical protein